MRKILYLFLTLSISILLVGASSATDKDVEEMDDKYVVFVDKYGISTAEFLKEINILHLYSQPHNAPIHLQHEAATATFQD